MKPELEQRLHAIRKEQLIQLVLELAARHPVLLAEMVSILESLTGEESLSEPGPEAAVHALPQPSLHHAPNDAASGISSQVGHEEQDIDEEVTEDWDFSGDEQVSLPSSLRPGPLPLDSRDHRQHVEKYASLLKEEKSPQILGGILTDLIEEAITHIEQTNYHSALDLFALLFDERLLERTPDLISIFDEMIDAAVPSLETLLGEASSNTIFDASKAALSPLLTSTIRHRWLERLFALWLKRLNAHRVEEDLPEIMLDIAWNEDILLLQSLAQNELQKQPYGEHSNIVDLTRQYRTKALEKFLKELS